MKIKQEFIIKLDFSEALALKIILGSLTDEEYKKKNINCNIREELRELYNLLPDYENVELV